MKCGDQAADFFGGGGSENVGATIAMLAPAPFGFAILDSHEALDHKRDFNTLIGMKQSVALPLFLLSTGDTVIVWVTAEVIYRRVTEGLEFLNVN